MRVHDHLVRGTLRVGPAGDRHEREADRVAGLSHAHAHGPGTEGGLVDVGTQRTIERARGRGRPLGEGFPGVRLHTDAVADRLNRGLRARAFTVGRDIFLRRGHTDVTSAAGRQLIAHELTHVAQQAGGPPVIQRDIFAIGPNQVYDDQLRITATEKSGFPGIYVGDIDGLDYEVGTATNGDPGLVPSTAGFAVSAAPSGFSIGGTASGGTGVSGVTISGVTISGGTVSGGTGASGGKAPFKAKAPPSWNPGPRDPYWRSPKGKTVISNSPGGTAWQQGPPTHTKKQRPNRTAAGYVNPGQFEPQMLPLWKAAAQSPIPANAQTDDDELVKWLQDPKRHFELTDSTQSQKMIVQGYLKPTGKRKMSQAVLGHHTSAGTLFNTGGHQQPRLTNYRYNQTIAPYHGLEYYKWSSASGHKEPRYESPRPDRGSMPEYYDKAHSDFAGVPWHTYSRMSDTDTLIYISGKLGGVPKAAQDGDFQRACMELARLQANFTQGHADELLAMIKTKGW